MTQLRENDFFDNPVPKELLVSGTNFLAEELGRGKDAVAYDACEGLVYRKGHEIVGHPPAGYIDHITDRAEREVAMYAELDESVCVARVVTAWVAHNRTHKLVEYAAGRPLFTQYQSGQSLTYDACRHDWEEGIARAADIPQAHFNELLQTDAILRENGAYIDFGGTGNLFYDAQKGFTVIDAEFESFAPPKGKGLYGAFLASFDRLGIVIPQEQTWNGRVSLQARENAIKILQKLEQAGHKPAYQLMFKLVCEKLEYVPDYAATSMS